MAKLCSFEWWKLVIEEVGKTDLAQDAPDFDFSFVFLSDVEGAVFINFEGGKVVDIHPATKEDEEITDFIIWASNDGWVGLATGKLSPELAMLIRKMVIRKGSKTRLLKKLSAASEIFTALKNSPFDI